MYLYCLQQVQDLGLADFTAQEEFFVQCAVNPAFVCSVLFSGDAGSLRMG
jgi:hypothetical protein